MFATLKQYKDSFPKEKIMTNLHGIPSERNLAIEPTICTTTCLGKLFRICQSCTESQAESVTETRKNHESQYSWCFVKT